MKKMLALLLVLTMLLGIAGCGFDANPISGEVDTSRFYFNQLTEYEQLLYTRLEEHEEDIIEGRKIEWFTYDEMDLIDESDDDYSFYRVEKAYRLDNPLANIWFCGFDVEVDSENQKVYIKPLSDSEGGYGRIDDAGVIRAMRNEMQVITSEFVETLSGTDDEKLAQIHNWILSGAYYAVDEEYDFLWTAWGVINSTDSKIACCEGFANAYKYVADQAGLSVISVDGIGEEEEYRLAVEEANKSGKAMIEANHRWNLALTQDGWKLVDLTWDIPEEPENMPPNTEWLFVEVKKNGDMDKKYHYESELFDYYPG